MPFCRFCTCQIKLITFCIEDYAIQLLFPHDASFLWSGRMHYHPSLEPVISRSVTSCPPLLSRARLTSPSVASSLSKLLFGLLPPQYIGGTLFSVLAISPGVLAKSIVDHNGTGRLYLGLSISTAHIHHDYHSSSLSLAVPKPLFATLSTRTTCGR